MYLLVLGLSLPGDVITEVEDAWKNVVDVVNRSCGSHSLEAEFFPFAEDFADFHVAVGEKCFQQIPMCESTNLYMSVT